MHRAGLATVGIMLVCVTPPSHARQAASAAVTTFAFGGSGWDVVNAVAVDAQGDIFIAGRTSSPDLPGLDRAYQKQLRGVGSFVGPTDAFVAKLDRTGRVLWSTLLGGNDARMSSRFGSPLDEARAIAVDAAGNVFVAGITGSTDFPTVNAFQSTAPSTRNGSYDGFLAKFNASGSELLFSTYIGGADDSSSVGAIALAPAGDIWIAVRSAARQFPHTELLSASGLIYVGRFTASGIATSWTRLGFGDDLVGGLRIDRFGQPHVLTQSPRAPCARGDPRPACGAILVTQLNAGGSRANFAWSMPSSTVGLPSLDLALGSDGTIGIAGAVNGLLPLVNAFQPAPGGGQDTFLALLGPGGVPEMVSYLGGAGSEPNLRAHLAIDLDGTLHVAFDTWSLNLTAVNGPVPRHPDGPVYTSDDRGESWRWAGAGLSTVSGFAIDVARNFVYAGSGGAIFRTADNGLTWQSVAAAGSFGVRTHVALDLRDSATLYVGTSDLHRVDLDGGATTLLRRATPGVGGFRVDSLAVSPHDGSVWIGTGSGVERSTDRGVSWTPRQNGLPSFSVGPFPLVESPRAILIDPRRPGTLFIGGSRGIFGTQDDGLSWTPLTGGPDSTGVVAMAFDPGDPDRIYAGTFNRGLLITDDAGATWRRALPFTAITAITVDHAPPHHVYAGVRDYNVGRSGVMVSRDRGVTWTWASGLPLRDAPGALIAHPGDPARLYAASGTVADAPYVTQLAPSRMHATLSYGATFASYLSAGKVADLALTPDGDTIVALSDARTRDVIIARVERLRHAATRW